MARDTTVDRVLHHAAVRGDKVAFRSKRGNDWVATTFREYGAACRAFAGGLLGEGLEPGDAVGIMGDNCPEWVIADVGAMAARAVPAGIYQTSTPEQIAYVAAHCATKVVVLQHGGLWERLQQQRHALPELRRVVMVRDGRSIDDPLVTSFEALTAEGRKRLDAVDERLRHIREADLATLIYTSGTTGPPKGAMLSHANLSFMARAAEGIARHASGAFLFGPRVTEHESVVSYLPLTHIAEQMFTVHVPAIMSAEVTFCEAMDKLRETLPVARPTIFLGVPRVWEKFRAALEGRLGALQGRQADVVAWARRVGLEVGRARVEGGRVTPAMIARYQAADRLFFRKLKAQLGLDRLKLAMTGAAPIAQDVLEFFLSCGLPIFEVYGQTEGTGGTTFNRPEPGKTKLGTAGLPIPGVTLKIAEDGEILARGPGTFMGYLKDEAATKATLVGGWLCTGDVGEIDAQGFLRITDRKKDLLVTSGGKNVAPQNVEKLLKAIAPVAQAVVIGDKRNYLTALLTVDAERRRALGLEDPKALEAHLQAGIDAMNAGLARYETVKKFLVLPNDFSVETGELTPTQKVKRKVVAEKYAREIASMYESP